MGAGGRNGSHEARLVTCSCGWGRECVSEWAAQSVSRLHQQLGELGVEHVTQIEPPEGHKSGEQLPLVSLGRVPFPAWMNSMKGSAVRPGRERSGDSSASQDRIQ
jgi:hypothetical protein